MSKKNKPRQGPLTITKVDLEAKTVTASGDIATFDDPIASAPLKYNVVRVDLVHQVDASLVADVSKGVIFDSDGIRCGDDFYPWANIRRVKFA